MSIIYAQELEGIELDRWVGHVRGLNIVGKALATYCPESGSPTITPTQKPAGPKSSFPTHEHYFYAPNCTCDVIYEDPELAEIMTSHNESTNKVLGHYWTCLYAVPEYSQDWGDGAKLMDEYNISCTPHYDNENNVIGRIAMFNDKDRSISMVAKDSLQAIMRLIVALHLGEAFNSSDYFTGVEM